MTLFQFFYLQFFSVVMSGLLSAAEVRRCRAEIVSESPGPTLFLTASRRRNRIERKTAFEQFQKLALDYVLDEGQRRPLIRSSEVDPVNEHIALHTDVASFYIQLTENPDLASPLDGMPELKKIEDRIQGSVVLYWPSQFSKTAAFDLSRTQGILRSLFQGGMNPMQWPWDPDLERIPTYPQIEALDALIDMEGKIPGKEGLKRAVVMPPAGGKSTLAGKYVKRIDAHNKARLESWRGKVKVLYVVEDSHIHEDAIPTLARECGFAADEIDRVFGEGAQSRFRKSSRLVAITRSNYFRRSGEIKALLSQAGQPWVLIFDEAHHTGNTKGQFSAVLRELEQVLDERHRVLLLSATLWHEDQILVRDYLHGQVWAPFLSQRQLAALQDGRDLEALSALIFRKAIRSGYSPAFEKLHLIPNLEKPFVEDLKERILTSRKMGEVDRGIIHVSTRDEANELAKELQRALGCEVRPFHKGKGSPPDTFDWFRDKQKVHKWVVVIKMMLEGQNAPNANKIVFSRKFYANPGGFKIHLQALGRVGRVGDVGWFKPSADIFDYGGFSRFWFEGLSEMMVERYVPISMPVRERLSARSLRIHLNEKEYSLPDFESEVRKFFDPNANFFEEFPTFRLSIFQDESMRFLHELSKDFGIAKFAFGGGLKKLIVKLAKGLEGFSDFISPEDVSDLLSALEDDKVWGWFDGDGSSAKSKRKESALPAVARIYRALDAIARLIRLDPRGEIIELRNLDRPSEIEKLVDLLYPDRPRSILEKSQQTLFLDRQQGAWGAFEVEASERGMPALSTKDGARNLLLAVAKDLADTYPEVYQIYFEEVENPSISSSAGHSGNLDYSKRTGPRGARPRNTSEFQSVYRFYYRLASVLEKNGQEVALEKLASKTEADKLLILARPSRMGFALTKNDLDLFLDPDKGSYQLLLRFSRALGVQALSAEHGVRDLVLKLTHLLRGAEAISLERAFAREQWPWPRRGIKFIEGSMPPFRFLYHSLYRVATVLKKKHPQFVFDPTRLHQWEQLDRFLGYLKFGFYLPHVTENEAKKLSKELSRWAEKKAKDLKVVPYVTQFGVQRLAQKLSGRLRFRFGDDRDKYFTWRFFNNILRDEEFWGWKTGDGENLKNQLSLGPVYRLQEALAGLGVLFKAFFPEESEELNDFRHLPTLLQVGELLSRDDTEH